MESVNKIRESNMELLRIIAMFLILVVHADFFTLGVPSSELITTRPIEGYVRLLIEAISVICVDVFVLLSGWYGIKFKIQGLVKFIYQCLFFSIGIYVFLIITGITRFSFGDLSRVLFADGDSFWFVKAYILLYVISPALNLFIERIDKKTYKTILILFFVFQSLYGWISSGADFLRSGYSTCSFVGLYLLSAYIRNNETKFLKSNSSFRFFIYFLLIVIVEAIIPYLVAFMTYNEHLTDFVISRVYKYTSPLVIVSSLFLLLSFAKMKVFYNKLINWVSISCFASCLLHGHPNIIGPYFSAPLKGIYVEYGFVVYLIKMMQLCFAYFIISIPLDKMRIYSFNFLMNLIHQNINKKLLL